MPSRFDRKYASRSKALTRPAIWTTQSTPSQPRRKACVSFRSPVTHSQGRSCTSDRSAWGRTSARTWCPCSRNRRVVRDPTNPFAPVMNTLDFEVGKGSGLFIDTNGLILAPASRLICPVGQADPISVHRDAQARVAHRHRIVATFDLNNQMTD